MRNNSLNNSCHSNSRDFLYRPSTNLSSVARVNRRCKQVIRFVSKSRHTQTLTCACDDGVYCCNSWSTTQSRRHLIYSLLWLLFYIRAHCIIYSNVSVFRVYAFTFCDVILLTWRPMLFYRICICIVYCGDKLDDAKKCRSRGVARDGPVDLGALVTSLSG